jgi:AcrR family transcriptional regulator
VCRKRRLALMTQWDIACYSQPMARWDPGAEERLKRAALELYLERGSDNVTVTHIAERAGLTRRSYFRYFPDKREVLFAGSERRAVIDASPELQERERAKTAAITEAIRDALKQRQVNAGTAELVAQLATVAFQNAFRHWIEAKGHASFGSCLHAVTDELRAALART